MSIRRDKCPVHRFFAANRRVTYAFHKPGSFRLEEGCSVVKIEGEFCAIFKAFLEFGNWPKQPLPPLHFGDLGGTAESLLLLFMHCSSNALY
jgi:hypothetical protein